MTTSNGGAGAADAGLNLSDLSSSRAEAKLEEAGTEFIQTMLQFDGLTQVMHASQISEVIETALQDKPDSQIQLDDEVCTNTDWPSCKEIHLSRHTLCLSTY